MTPLVLSALIGINIFAATERRDGFRHVSWLLNDLPQDRGKKDFRHSNLVQSCQGNYSKPWREIEDLPNPTDWKKHRGWRFSIIPTTHAGGGEPLGPFSVSGFLTNPKGCPVAIETENHAFNLTRFDVTIRKAKGKPLLWFREEAFLERRLDEIVIAPDGSFALLAYAITAGDAARYQVLLATWDGRIRPLTDEPVAIAEISPDSRLILVEGLKLIDLQSWTTRTLAPNWSGSTGKGYPSLVGWSKQGNNIAMAVFEFVENPKWEEHWIVELPVD